MLLLRNKGASHIQGRPFRRAGNPAENRRILPHNELAARTIGYLNLGSDGTRGE